MSLQTGMTFPSFISPRPARQELYYFFFATMTTGANVLHSPLTTTFIPPATCTDSFAYDGIWPYTTSSSRPILQASYPQSSACFAPGWTSASNSYAKGANFWSGTPVCPNEQTVAQTESTGTWTTAICCSRCVGSGFSFSIRISIC